MRFFGDLSLAETAVVPGAPLATVKRDWSVGPLFFCSRQCKPRARWPQITEIAAACQEISGEAEREANLLRVGGDASAKRLITLRRAQFALAENEKRTDSTRLAPSEDAQNNLTAGSGGSCVDQVIAPERDVNGDGRNAQDDVWPEREIGRLTKIPA